MEQKNGMSLVVNVTQDWGIGRENQLLVSLPGDLRRFRQLTIGKTVILGRRTLATFPGGRPLPGRENFILSRDPAFQVPGARVFSDLPALLQAARALPDGSLCVIGGASVYAALLDYCSMAYVTKTFLSPPADRFFPDLDALTQWSVVERSPLQEENGVTYQYINYQNAAPKLLAERKSL